MFSVNLAGQTTVFWNAGEAAANQASGEILESQLPIVRANLEGPDEVWVGQAVSLNVEVIVPTWFTDSPEFPDIEIENALTLSTGDAVNAVVQSGGQTFSGQARQYLIFPQVSGSYMIPSITVSVSYALQDGKQRDQVTGKQKRQQARADSDAQGSGDFMLSSIREKMAGQSFLQYMFKQEKGNGYSDNASAQIIYNRPPNVNPIGLG